MIQIGSIIRHDQQLRSWPQCRSPCGPAPRNVGDIRHKVEKISLLTQHSGKAVGHERLFHRLPYFNGSSSHGNRLAKITGWPEEDFLIILSNNEACQCCSIFEKHLLLPKAFGDLPGWVEDRFDNFPRGQGTARPGQVGPKPPTGRSQLVAIRAGRR